MHDFNIWYTLLTLVVIMGALQGTTAFLILVERKIAGWVQDRIGPNRVGPKGLFQPLADGLKFLLKEEMIPGYVDKVLFLLAPCIAMGVAMFAFAVVPFGPVEPPPRMTVMKKNHVTLEQAAVIAQKADGERTATEKAIVEEYGRYQAYRGSYQFVIAPGVDIGIVFIFAISSLAVYGVILGGWSANNKYSFLGALRSSAQIISYEIPLGLSVLGIFLMSGSLNLERIIWQQIPAGGTEATDGMWYVFVQPLAFVIFLVSAFAETNRLPFDLPEAEQELVGGYHTEYSAFKFGMFFLGEYTHMITTSFLMVILFFGGWHFPFIATADSFWLIKLAVFGAKMAGFIVFYMLVRWTIPRFRFDQLMGLAWKVMIPLALVNLVLVMVVKQLNLSLWWLLPLSLAALVGSAAFAVGGPSKPARRREAGELALTQ
ncbi:MAG: NADH-quinone oxidoreductase subunit NuoH [Gemmataceae bacterium]